MMNILMIDDEEDARTFTKDLLVSAGHHVTSATSGLEAIMHVEIQRFDLVLLDLMMPGVDGFQFAEYMSCHWKTFETPVVIVSCRKDPESTSLARVYNCAGYLEKPYSPAELFDLVRKLDYDRTMTALGDSMHCMHSVLLEFTPYTAARRF